MRAAGLLVCSQLSGLLALCLSGLLTLCLSGLLTPGKIVFAALARLGAIIFV